MESQGAIDRPGAVEPVIMMKQSTTSSKTRAMEALEALLARASAIELKDVDLEIVNEGCEIDIVAHIEALGRSHTLACRLVGDGALEHVRTALERLRLDISQLPGEVTPVIMVPCLSQEVRELCREGNAGYLDLHGNGCLAFGEVFISQRSSPCHALFQSSVALERARHAKASRKRPEKFPPAQAGLPSRNFGTGKLA